ncbi:DUF5825 family protein [Streptomyces chrestomyceticus]|uniref:DUF5825 family protein n=1 Tax=Streptomyces chrestomyceticus TaxID=68185 RepID=UPI003402821B
MNKCGYRRGTGFVEVTDLRQGTQRRVLISQVNKGKVASLLDGAPVSDFRQQEREAFTKSGLVHQVAPFCGGCPPVSADGGCGVTEGSKRRGARPGTRHRMESKGHGPWHNHRAAALPPRG